MNKEENNNYQRLNEEKDIDEEKDADENKQNQVVDNNSNKDIVLPINQQQQEPDQFSQQQRSHFSVILHSLIWLINLFSGLSLLVYFFYILPRSNSYEYLTFDDYYYYLRLLWMITLIILLLWSLKRVNSIKKHNNDNDNDNISFFLLALSLLYSISMSFFTLFHYHRECLYYFAMTIILFLPRILLIHNIKLDNWHYLQNKSICQKIVGINYSILLIIEVFLPCFDFDAFAKLFNNLLTSKKGYAIIFFSRPLMIMYVYKSACLFLFKSHSIYSHHIPYKFIFIIISIISISAEFTSDETTEKYIKKIVSCVWIGAYIIMLLYNFIVLIYICFQQQQQYIQQQCIQLQQQQQNQKIKLKDSIEGGIALVGDIFVGLTYLAANSWENDTVLIRAILGTAIDISSFFILLVIIGINKNHFQKSKILKCFVWLEAVLNTSMMLRLFLYEYNDIVCIIDIDDYECHGPGSNNNNKWWHVYFGFFFIAIEYHYWLMEHYFDILFTISHKDESYHNN